MKSYKDQGLVILHRQLKEADQLIVIWTFKEGKKAFIVKGASKILGKKLSALDTLNHISFTAIGGKTEHHLLVEATIVNDFSNIKKDLQATSVAMYMLEVLDRFLVVEESNERFFNICLETISSIDSNIKLAELYLLFFQLQLLINSGFAPSLNHCINCFDDLIENEPRIASDTNEPGYLCQKHFDNISKQLNIISDTIIKIQRFMSNASVETIQHLKISENDLLSIFNIQNTWIESISERTINSKSLLNLWKKQKK